MEATQAGENIVIFTQPELKINMFFKKNGKSSLNINTKYINVALSR